MPLENSASSASDNRYLFWSRYTAAQAHNTGRPAKRFDRRVEAFFHEICKQVQPTISLELGAHEGTFSSWAKGAFPDARCLAVEANPFVHEKHHERLAAEGVEYRHVAAASSNGTVTIHIPGRVNQRTLSRANRMASLAIHSRSTGNEMVEVPSARVDDLVERPDDARIVAWIDVEGASDQVLSGARDTLASAAAVYIEVESVSAWHGQWLDVDVARYFDALGMVPVVRDIQRHHQYNVVFLHHELAARPEISERASRVLVPLRKASPTT